MGVMTELIVAPAAAATKVLELGGGANCPWPRDGMAEFGPDHLMALKRMLLGVKPLSEPPTFRNPFTGDMHSIEHLSEFDVVRDEDQEAIVLVVPAEMTAALAAIEDVPERAARWAATFAATKHTFSQQLAAANATDLLDRLRTLARTAVARTATLFVWQSP